MFVQDGIYFTALFTFCLCVLDFQNYLRTQTGNNTTVNIIISTVDYLLRVQVSQQWQIFQIYNCPAEFEWPILNDYIFIFHEVENPLIVKSSWCHNRLYLVLKGMFHVSTWPANIFLWLTTGVNQWLLLVLFRKGHDWWTWPT